MTRLLLVVPALLALAGAAWSDEAELVRRLEKLGAKVTRNEKLPGKPVVYVVFPKNTKNADLKGIGELKELRSLQASNSPEVTDDGLKELAGLKKLESLSLFLSGVTDAGLKELSGLEALRELVLDNTRVNGSGLRHLAKNTKLRGLYLGYTPMTDDGLRELRLNPAFRKLGTVYLQGCRSVTNEAVIELKRALSECMVHGVDGNLVKIK